LIVFGLISWVLGMAAILQLTGGGDNRFYWAAALMFLAMVFANFLPEGGYYEDLTPYGHLTN
jgi:hypothetical protein